MINVKEIKKSGLTAWSNSKNNPTLFAVGSISQSELLSEQGTLSLYNFDKTSRSKTASPLISVPTSSSFLSLAWDQFGEQNNYPDGIIAGGLQDCTLGFWDASQFINGSKNYLKNPSFYQEQINYGCLSMLSFQEGNSIYSLEFNPHKPSLIATGGTELLILNIENDIENPDSYKAGEPNPHVGQTITSVSWNRKVQHILASSSSHGIVAIWDLKIKKPIFNIADKHQTDGDHSTSICWNPEIATQLAVCYDNDKAPEVQIWDLRNPSGPVRVMNQGHSGGVHQVSWSNTEPNLVISADRENNVVCWDYKTEQKKFSTKCDTDILDIKWARKLKGIFQYSDVNGDIKINKLIDQDSEPSNAKEELFVPDWLKKPAGAAVSFAGNISTFHETTGTKINLLQVKPVFSKTVEKLNTMQSSFEKIKSYQELCDHMIATKESNLLRDIWSYAKTIIQDPNDIICLLGFNKKDIVSKTEQYTGKKHQKEIVIEEKNPGVKTISHTAFKDLNPEEADAFFDELGGTTVSENKPTQEKVSDFNIQSGEREVIEKIEILRNINWDAGIEFLIKQNICIGNIEGAVDCLLQKGRGAEAMLLAYTHSPELLQSTINSFSLTLDDFFFRDIVQNLGQKDWGKIVESYDIEKWKECAALIFSAYTENDFQCYKQKGITHTDILNLLGNRVSENSTLKHLHAPLKIYFLSRNEDKILEHLFKLIDNEKNLENRRNLMLDVCEILLAITALGDKTYKFNPIKTKQFYSIFTEIIQLLLGYNFDLFAYEILDLIMPSGKEDSKELGQLKYRLWYSSSLIQDLFNQPNKPFQPLLIPFQKKQAHPAAQIKQSSGITAHVQPQINKSFNPQSIPNETNKALPPSTNINASNKAKVSTFPFAVPPVVTKPPEEKIINPPVSTNIVKPPMITNSGSLPVTRPNIVAPIVKPPAINTHSNIHSSTVVQPPPLIQPPPVTHPPVVAHPPLQSNPNPVTHIPPQLNPSHIVHPPHQFNPNPVTHNIVTPPPPIIHSKIGTTVNQEAFKETNLQSDLNKNSSSPTKIAQNFPPSNVKTVRPLNPPPIIKPTMPNLNNNIAPPPMSRNTSVSHPEQTKPQSMNTTMTSHIDYLRQAAELMKSFERDPKKLAELKENINVLINHLSNNTLKQEIFDLVKNIVQNLMIADQKSAQLALNSLIRIDYAEHQGWMNALKRIIMRR